MKLPPRFENWIQYWNNLCTDDLTMYVFILQDKLRQRGVFDTLRNDFTVAFSNWEFDPMDLSNPFPQNQSSVHIWQGYEDKVVPFQLQRYVSSKLPWIQYHEVPDGGHLIVHYNGLSEAIVRALLYQENPLWYKPSLAKKTKRRKNVPCLSV